MAEELDEATRHLKFANLEPIGGRIVVDRESGVRVGGVRQVDAAPLALRVELLELGDRLAVEGQRVAVPATLHGAIDIDVLSTDVDVVGIHHGSGRGADLVEEGLGRRTGRVSGETAADSPRRASAIPKLKWASA